MAKTFGIPISQRRAYRTTIPREPPVTLPPLTQRSSMVGKKASKISDTIQAVNKEKWSFLQRLLAIEEKHERKKMSRQKEMSSQKREQYCGSHEDQGSNAVASGRWISDQILDDTAESSFNRDKILFPSRDGDSGVDKSLYVSSLPNIDQVFPKHHQDTASNDTYLSNNLVAEQPSHPSQAQQQQQQQQEQQQQQQQRQQREQSPMSRVKRKRPLRLPPILLPPLHATRPRPLQERDFLTPTRVRGPITDAEWDDLYNCRYIRHAKSKYALQLSPSESSFYC